MEAQNPSKVKNS